MPTDPRRYLDLEFDAANTRHLARHRITRADVETVFASQPDVRRNKRTGAGDYLVTGRGRGGRRLVIVVVWADEAERVLRPITGRELS